MGLGIFRYPRFLFFLLGRTNGVPLPVQACACQCQGKLASCVPAAHDGYGGRSP